MIEMTDEEIKVMRKADFKTVLDWFNLAAIFWFTTVDMDKEDRHSTRLSVGNTKDIKRMPSMDKILVKNIL